MQWVNSCLSVEVDTHVCVAISDGQTVDWIFSGVGFIFFLVEVADVQHWWELVSVHTHVTRHTGRPLTIRGSHNELKYINDKNKYSRAPDKDLT